MKEYRFKLAKFIEAGDRLLVCSVWYVVSMKVKRNLGIDENYVQLFLQVSGAKTTENTGLIMVYPDGAIVKVQVATLS